MGKISRRRPHQQRQNQQAAANQAASSTNNNNKHRKLGFKSVFTAAVVAGAGILATKFYPGNNSQASHTQVANDEHSKEDLKEKFIDTVGSAIKAMRTKRGEYERSSTQEKKQYDESVRKTVDCFFEQQNNLGSRSWDEHRVVRDLNKCGFEHNYPRTVNIEDPQWEASVAYQEGKTKRMEDKTYLGNSYDLNKLDKLVAASRDGKSHSTIHGLKLAHHYAPESAPKGHSQFRITLDGEPIAALVLTGELGNGRSRKAQDKFGNIVPIKPPVYEAIIQRAALVGQAPLTAFDQKECAPETSISRREEECFYPASKVAEKAMNEVANKLINGDFKDQDEAIDLLLDYKVLTSLAWSIIEARGTQFKNIVKINALVETIKNKFPDKIDQNLNIPHYHDDSRFDQPVDTKNSPEVAVLLKSVNDFKKVEKKKIIQELNQEQNNVSV